MLCTRMHTCAHLHPCKRNNIHGAFYKVKALLGCVCMCVYLLEALGSINPCHNYYGGSLLLYLDSQVQVHIFLCSAVYEGNAICPTFTHEAEQYT